MDSVLLKAQELSYSYHTLNGETPALDRVSFCLYRKEFLAIVGPSGCGKSTILSLIAGLLTPGSGGITFYGENGHQPGIGYMLQHDLLFEWRNVWQNVTLGLEIAHKDTVKNLERVHRMLSDYGLLEFQHKKPSQLSGGMRQRAALIRTMALEPDILLLDEPFSALDYQTRMNLQAPWTPRPAPRCSSSCESSMRGGPPSSSSPTILQKLSASPIAFSSCLPAPPVSKQNFPFT